MRLPIVILATFCLILIHTSPSTTLDQSNLPIEKHAFQTEVSRMMKLIINSLYTNKDIFLRELISNASDALDKIRIIALTSKKALDSLGELKIRIKPDEAKSAIHVIDSGVGMTKKELINNLGTIAKSGTSEFLKQYMDNPDQTQLNDLIGQFGVGFYSSFLVADKVTVRSKSHSDPIENIWQSDSNEFTVKTATDEDRLDGSGKLDRGSVVTLHLKEEAKDFLRPDTLKEIIQKYSQFVDFPIYLWTSKQVTEEVPVEEDGDQEASDSDAATEKKETTTTEKPSSADDDTVDEEKEKKQDEAKKVKKTKKVEKTVYDWERINVAKPIWQRKPSEVSDEEYNEFYKSLTRDFNPPLARSHFTAEGEMTFKSVLFVPKNQPVESFNKYGGKSDNVKLYVKRVFISNDFNDLMPNYLSFIRAVVDSDDLPLNVGRETLQQHKLIKVIKKKLVRKALDMIHKIDEDKYSEFWKEFSTNIKLGIIEDQTNRNRIAKLLRFHTSKTGPDQWKSLPEYIKDMPSDQEQIYYIAGTSYDEVSQSPFVERVLEKGYEVLYLTDAVDEYAIANLADFENKKFQNIAKEGLNLGKSSESDKKSIEKKFSKLISYIQDNILKDKVHKVVLSERLAESPAALVATAFGWTGNMERLAKSNAHAKSSDITRDYYLKQKKIFEINPKHPIIKELLRRVEEDEGDAKAKDTTKLLFSMATIRSGYILQETEDFGKGIERLLRNELHVSQDAPIEDVQIDSDDDLSPDEKQNEPEESVDSDRSEL